ncbi:mycofactocin biosynthesis peptidyl-dipeptidase MftE [Sciscionella sediminilitoris]|uniref:mycofactocin biosynthesis peptidyl-dipeptidase MftE n=1 Tax=Sciscionella sediminilitoris TaxID=1445613 RepID=UPI0004DF0CAF|nr:mycofactocin biosynthesis peptidyl-dipeptidase MftE [Sciscionella sp. SE31]
MTDHLADTTWPELDQAGLVLVPVGSIEQHGPHLPLDTDTAIATAVTHTAAGILGAWSAPAIAYGASGEHQGFPGTSSIGTDTLRLLLIELVRSMRVWARRVLLVNAHGGNLPAIDAAVGQLVAEGHDIAWIPCATTGPDLHAGRTETSLMLHIRPESVHLDRAEKGNTQPLDNILPDLIAGGVDAVSTNGVLGDPAGATAEEGGQLLARMVDAVVSTATSVTS